MDDTQRSGIGDTPCVRGAGRDGTGRVRVDGALGYTRSPLTWRRWLVLVPVSVLVGVFGCAALLQSSEQRVVLSSDPAGAEVIVNGAPSGTTPVEVVLNPTGKYVVEFQKAGCRPFSQELAHEGAFGSMGGVVEYPVTQLKSAHVQLACGR